MKNLLIIGAGGCGREVLQWAKNVNEVGLRWHIKGFLDDNLNALDGKRCRMAVLSRIDEYEITPDDEFVCCIGNSEIRESVVERLRGKGAKFVTIAHPSAVISESCIIGNGTIIYPYALISDNAVIGNNCIINMYSSVAHDSVLGNYCTISAHCDVTGMCNLGDKVFMGSSSHIIPGVTIGNDVYIGAGSTVLSKVQDGLKMFGNPARIVKY